MVNYTPASIGTVRNDLIVDTTSYTSGEIIESFEGLQGLEPRLGVNYKTSENSAIKASYNRMRQYLHLISKIPLLHYLLIHGARQVVTSNQVLQTKWP